jgi:pimeloyl-ACP methyl ester carboxylesterase
VILHSKILGDSNKHILILHGFLGSGDNWISIARKLNPLGYTIHLIDQRNHGRSFHSEKFNYDLMSEDLFNYIKHHKIENSILIGHSMGGKTAMNFSLIHPKLVSKLIVLDTSPRGYPVLHQKIIDSLKEIDLSVFVTRKEIDIELRKSVNQQGLRNFLLKNIYRMNDGKLNFRFNLQSLSQNIGKIGQKIESETQFTREVIFIKGETSDYINESDKVMINNLFPNAKFYKIPNAGHWLHVDNPIDFISILLSLI